MRLRTGESISWKFMLMTASFVIIVAGMRAAASLLVPFMLAIFLAVICTSPLFWLRRVGVPTPLAVFLVAVGLLGIGFLVSAFIGNALKNFTMSLPEYQKIFQEKTLGIAAWLDTRGIDTSQFDGMDFIETGSVMRFITGFLGGLSGLLTNMFVILLTVIFILFEAAGMPSKLRSALGETGEAPAGFSRFTESVMRYLAVKTWCSLLTGAIVVALLKIVGVKQPYLWGFIAFLLNYVPNIGSTIAAVPGIAMAMIQFDLTHALYTGMGYAAINMGVSYGIEPKWMGSRLGLSTLVVFISLVFWTWVLGPVGMLLSVPLTMTVKIALESGPGTRWIGVLLGPAKIIGDAGAAAPVPPPAAQ
ncbi:AI-2E family transporter [Desulfococcus sp.]|uniref:AI-2E family transporter n=1 Tax=Desulfococcus sp. TaxID=2025834 RepID=UPI0035948FAE